MRNLLRPIIPAVLAVTAALTHITAAQAAAPMTLTAVPGTQQSAPTVVLTWTGAAAGAQFLVYRDSRVLSAASGSTYTDSNVHGGETHRYFVIKWRPTAGTSNTVTVSIPTPPPAAPVAPSAPAHLTAGGLWDAARSIPTVQLGWDAVAGAGGYNVYRDGALLQSGVTAAGFTDAAVTSGRAYAYAVTATGPGGESARSAAVSVTAPTPPPPAAPTGLSATGIWEPNCVECAGMAMPEVQLSWQASPGATGYKVYRNGALLQSGLTAAAFEDMTVTSGQTYAYTVAATGPGGESPRSGQATATAPNPPPTGTTGTTGTTTPMGTALIAPTNLASHPFWQGRPSDTLTWSPASGAVSYNVYQYDTPIARGVTGTTYTLPFSVFQGGILYTVTAVDAMGMESLPSNPSFAYDGLDPANLPGWASPFVPAPVQKLTARPEWNNGAPRIALSWLRGGDRYDLFRDGVKVASDLFCLTYFDNSVNPGETHTYAVASLNHYVTPGVESPLSGPVTATALTGAPAPLPTRVQIVDVQAEDDSAKVYFAPVAGARDYRVYDVSKPGSVKYMGVFAQYTGEMMDRGEGPFPLPNKLSIQWNGIDPARGADLVVEAVDKPGPFQKMDGAMGPGAMQMGGVSSAINGQGDPSNVPNVIARSDTFHVTCVARTLTGSQAFFDNFRSEAPLTPATLEPVLAAINAAGHPVSELENDKWRIRTFGADDSMTRSFFMGNHFMDTLYDGPFAQHNNNASLVMIPKSTADISGGKVLHVTFEMDAHFGGRRWCDLMIGEAGDTLLHSAPGKLQDWEMPTVKGNLLFWEITAGMHDIQLVTPSPDANAPVKHVFTGLRQETDYSDYISMSRYYEVQWQWGVPSANGFSQDLDKRSRFDLYLSQNHYRFIETLPDGVTQIKHEKNFPSGKTLPFSRIQVYFTHELYHTGNDRPENVSGGPDNAYWYNYRPFSDERHWDNMGFEVLPSFPA